MTVTSPHPLHTIIVSASAEALLLGCGIVVSVESQHFGAWFDPLQ